MKLTNKLVVVMAILLFITIHRTYSGEVNPVAATTYSSAKLKDTNRYTDLFKPGNIILVKLP